MEAIGKPTNADTDAVFDLEVSRGDLIVTFFDHTGADVGEQPVGSLRFPNYLFDRDQGDLGYTAREMALGIWNLMRALDAAGVMPCGSCFAFSREDEPPPREGGPKDGLEQGPYLPLWLAYDDLVESRTVDGGIDTAPFPYQ